MTPGYRRCDPETQEAPCNGLTDPNAEWNVYTKVTQIWDEVAQKYLPETTGTYNETPSPNECRFKCKDNYTYNGTNCAANTRQMPCTGLPSYASWWNMTVTQTWNGDTQGWQPAIETRHSENAVEDPEYCYFTCNENYRWDSVGNACVGKTQEADCDEDTLPQNAVWWNDGSVTQTWNGYVWMPATSGSYKSDASAEEGCYFKCKDHRYKWNQAERSCDCSTGYFWNQSSGECESPCDTVANNCGAHSVCKATSLDTFDCECESGYVSENLECHERRFWGFEDAWEDTSSGIISIDNSAEYHWARTNAYGANTGSYAMCSDNYNVSNSIAEMIINVDIPTDGVVFFYIKGTGLISSGQDREYFELYVDGNNKSDMILTSQTTIWGSNTDGSIIKTGWNNYWTLHGLPLTAGSHALKFSYKYHSGTIGTGRFCIDDLAIMPECYSSGTPCIDLSSGIVWSEKQAKMNWQSAVDYCGSYSESGLSGWKLPDISELRTLIQNCANTVTGGVCDIQNFNSSDCRCSDNYNGLYSKFGEKDEYLWSSTEYTNTDSAWTVRFIYAAPSPIVKANSLSIRCAKNLFDDEGPAYILHKRSCTDQGKCYDNSAEMTCPAVGEDFFGQDAQYAENGYCAPKSFEIRGSGSEQTVYDSNTGLEWQQTIPESGYIF